MNCKLEKFWNISKVSYLETVTLWTVNLKSFEIISDLELAFSSWTVNLKSFEISITNLKVGPFREWTVNLKSFEINSIPPEIFNLYLMNCKLEKFWNKSQFTIYSKEEQDEL